MTVAWEKGLRRCSQAASLLVVTCAMLVLLGWVFDVPTLKSVLPGLVTMKANTAFCFISLGLATAWSNVSSSDTGRRVVQVVALAVVLVGALTLSETFLGWDLGIDEAVFDDLSGGVSQFRGRMSVITAFNFVLLGSALLMLASPDHAAPRFADIIIYLVALIGFLGLAGYVSGAPALYRVGSFNPMALHTAALFVVLATGMLTLPPIRGLAALLAGNDVGAAMASKLLPMALIVPPAVGLIRLFGERRGLYGKEFGLALFATATVVILIVAIYLAALSMRRTDEERLDLERSLRESYAGLEQRVMERTSELEATVKEREVLLQEVHHRVKNNLQVISSLVNLQVRELKDPASRTALKECQTRIQAIALIHEQLYQSKDYSRIPFSEYAKNLVDNIFRVSGASSAAVSLKMEIEPLALAVDKAIPCGLILNELLTNAFKHAFPDGRTGNVRVGLRKSGDRHVVLTVADNGIGLKTQLDPAKAHSLGMQLVTTLVEQLDGTLDVASYGGTTFSVTFLA